MRTLAERLKAEREAAGLTQEDLAKKSNTGQSMIGNLESGLRKGSAKLPNIAAALGLHALWLKEERGPKHLDAGQSLQDGLYVTDPELIEIITELQNAPEVVRRQMLKEANRWPTSPSSSKATAPTARIYYFPARAPRSCDP